MGSLSKNDDISIFLEITYKNYKKPLLRIIKKYLGDSDSCEDVFQEVMIKIIHKADFLKALSTPKLEAYIVLVARGTSIDYLRKKNSGNQVYLSDDTLEDLQGNSTITVPSFPSPFSKVDLSLMMHNISHDEELLLIGKYYIGLSIQDLAEIVGDSESCVKSRLYRARKKLYEEWKNSGLSMEDFLNE